jgi:hypothetical protein
MQFHFVTVVWGNEFTDLFIRAVLPNHLSAGNLDAFTRKEAVYKIYTTNKDAVAIKASDAYQQLLRAVSVEITAIDEYLTPKYKYRTMTECHKLAVSALKGLDAAIVLLPADQIYSRGTFGRLKRLAGEGYRAVMVAGLRVSKESFVPEFISRSAKAGCKDMGADPAELLALALRNLHPISSSLIWNPDRMSAWPSHVYFPVEEEGLVIRAFHLHPLLVYPVRKDATISNTFDDDYLRKACPDPSKIYVVEDSDEILPIEISSASQLHGLRYGRMSAFRLALWAKYHTDDFHRSFFKRKIFYHSGRRSGRWKRVEDRSDRIADAALSWLKYESFLFNPLESYKKARSIAARWLKQ